MQGLTRALAMLLSPAMHVDMNRMISGGVAAILVLIACLATEQARAQEQCPVIGSVSTWGFPANGSFDVSAGGACLFGLNLPDGEILSAVIKQAPANGTLTMVNVSTFTYTPNPGFTGTDAFAIEATGNSIGGPVGTSVITMNATVR
jgi:hypothetical protein